MTAESENNQNNILQLWQMEAGQNQLGQRVNLPLYANGQQTLIDGEIIKVGDPVEIRVLAIKNMEVKK